MADLRGDGGVSHVDERSDRAARTVDPLLLANALDHIARTARLSHTQTRRLRWIEQRANLALAGKEYRDIDVDLPKHATEESMERVKKDRAAVRKSNAELLEALVALHAVARVDRDEDYAAITNAAAVIAKATGSDS